MQASKVNPGEVYAYKRGDENFRFYVTAVLSRRDTRSKNATSEIEGYVVEDVPENHPQGNVPFRFTTDPSKLEGPWDQVQELVERKKREDEELKRKNAEHRAEQVAIRRDLYRFVGVEPPVGETGKKYGRGEHDDPSDQPFPLGTYDRSKVDVTDAGVKLLVEKIRSLKPKLAVVHDPEDSFSDRTWRP